MVNVKVTKRTVLRNSEAGKQEEACMPSSTSAWACLLGPPLETGNFIIRNLKRLCCALSPGCEAVTVPILPHAAMPARCLYCSKLKK